MKGSAVNNIKFNPDTEKLINCMVCGNTMLVGKFSKKEQECFYCKESKKESKAVKNTPKLYEIDDPPGSFGKKLGNLATKLNFEITSKRLWRKKYAIDGGGIATIHIMVGPAVTGDKAKIEYFSLTVQRAIGVNENFRKFMPTDAASDCEILAAELAETNIARPQVGQEKCDKCGAFTDEFGVDAAFNKILCVKPNNCFRKKFTNAGAGSVE